MSKLVTIIILSLSLLLAAPAAHAGGQHPAHSAEARDLMGIAESLYQGKHYNPARWEKFRRCVIHRESRGNYRAANKTSSARGAYQFLDRSWRDGLVWMLLPEHREQGLADQVKTLRDKPIHEWNRYWQDAAFWTVIMAQPDNWRHWRGGSCDRLA
jgi:hypothetical protein